MMGGRQWIKCKALDLSEGGKDCFITSPAEIRTDERGEALHS